MGRHTHFLCVHDHIQPPLDIDLTPLSTTAVPMATCMIYIAQIQESACVIAVGIEEPKLVGEKYQECLYKWL